MNGLLENQRDSRMSSPNLFDKRKQPLLDHIRPRVGKNVKHKRIRLNVAEHVCKIRLHLGIAAAPETEHLQTRSPHKLHWIAHSTAARANSLV